jgi:hypothetical protein
MKMKKLRVIFISCSILIAITSFFWLNSPDFSLNAPGKYSGYLEKGFQVTGISEKGDLYINNDETRLADVKTSIFSTETRLRSDDQTAWEFFFEGVLFSALPGSGIHYTPQTRELILENGEFYWEKKLSRQNTEISLLKAGNILRLSASGRIRLRDRFLEIWNYSGQIDLDYNGKAHHLQELQYLKTGDGGKLAPVNLFPPPPSISPENETISLIHLNDTIIQFKWKNVRGASNYLLKVYPSYFRDSILSSKVVTGNTIMLDILPFIEYSELYWEVAAFDEARNIESIPARMGVIKISSSMLKKGTVSQPPKIEVSSLSVSGNMVLIKGSTDPNAQLSIEGISIKLDSEGKFIHTISYKSIGIKGIVFKAMAPSGLETVLKKQVTIFEE